MAKAGTLEDLKAENAKAEEEAKIAPQAIEEEPEEEAAAVEPEELEGDADPEDSETDETEVEAFMLTDDDRPADEKKFTDGDIGAAKKKLRAKLEDKHNSEMEELRAENERLKGSRPASVNAARPTLDDFENSENPQEAYEDALMDWKISKNNAATQTHNANAEQEQRAAQAQRETNTSVDQHYERAVVPAEKSGISPELYQSSDLKVRQSIESIFPGAGDAITDRMIADLGSGSEKVMYNLGVNKKRLAEFQQILRADPGGIKAAMYLGKLNAELDAPRKRKTNAPTPAPVVNGDSKTVVDFKSEKKKYDAARKSGNLQAAFDAKMAAKRAGAPTSTW